MSSVIPKVEAPAESWPRFSTAEMAAVQDVLASGKVNYWTGQEGRKFEEEFSTFFGVRKSIAVMNGTVALDAALSAIGVGKGDEVIVTSRTFIASVSSIVNAGATPIFADVDLDSQNITADTISRVLSEKTKAIVCVHLAGWPCDMPAIKALALAEGLQLIEDCAQAHGASINGQSVGQFSDIAAWSFCQDKILSTGGEGGMVTTDSEELWSHVWSLKDHGKSWDAIQTAYVPGQFKWVHEKFGTNWRMPEIQSAIGRVQLTQLPQWSNMRLSHANAIWDAASQIPGLRVPVRPANIVHAAYKCYVFVEPTALRSAWTRDRIVGELCSQGFGVGVGSCSEVYREKAFLHTQFSPKKPLHAARQLGETSIMMQVHPTLSRQSVFRLIEALQGVMAKAVMPIARPKDHKILSSTLPG